MLFATPKHKLDTTQPIQRKQVVLGVKISWYKLCITSILNNGYCIHVYLFAEHVVYEGKYQKILYRWKVEIDPEHRTQNTKHKAEDSV